MHLVTRRGIEVGHVFKLDTRYSVDLDAQVQLADGSSRHILMGCYGIGLGRLLAAAVEQHHDDKGMTLPRAIAPYEVILTSLNASDDAVADAAERLYEELRAAGLEVLYDDRAESAGVKLNDADLLGMPVRVLVSPRGLRGGTVEVKARTAADALAVPPERVVEETLALLAA